MRYLLKKDRSEVDFVDPRAFLEAKFEPFEVDELDRVAVLKILEFFCGVDVITQDMSAERQKLSEKDSRTNVDIETE